MLVRPRSTPEETESGFTLIELLVVIIIIGILAAIAIPVFLNQRKKGYDAQAQADLRNVATAEESYLTDHPSAYAPCDSSTGATSCTNMLSSQVWKPSPGTLTAVGADSLVGFCAVSKSLAGNYFVYDSLAGGLQATKDTSFAAITWPGGACTAPGSRPGTF